MLKTFIRPELSEEEKNKIPKWANIIINSKGRQTAIAIMVRLIMENMILTKEVNQHRDAQGFEKLPEYEPKF